MQAKCGSGLAREDSRSLNTSLPERPLSRASPAPTFGLGLAQNLCQAQISVGAGLPAMAVGQSAKPLLIHRLREQARSHILIFTRLQSVVTPLHFKHHFKMMPVNNEMDLTACGPNVGAGLLAKTAGQSMHHCQNDCYRGQARLSPLYCGGLRIYVRHQKVWELACLRWRWFSLPSRY